MQSATTNTPDTTEAAQRRITRFLGHHSEWDDERKQRWSSLYLFVATSSTVQSSRRAAYIRSLLRWP
jgi:hypothetical protein